MKQAELAPTKTVPNLPNNPSEPRILSDIVVDYLGQLGVEYVFGVPGGHIAPLYEALGRSERKGGPRAILSRHESGAASMADAYARETGKIGVCCATTGPGATNLITGVASAYTDRIPLLVITGQTLLSRFGVGAFQESSPDWMDTARMFDSCTRYNTIVTHPKQLENKLVAALKTAFQSPPGPVHISVPVDVFRSPAPEQIAYPNFTELLTKPSSFVDLAALEELCQALYRVLSKGRKVVLLIGHDCKGASQEIIAFAELINAAIMTTQDGKTCINAYHPLARGVFGFGGHKTAREALTDESVDLILAVGTSLAQWATSAWDKALLNDKLVHIHHANIYFGRTPMAGLHLQGTIKTIFQELVVRLEAMQGSGKLNLPTFVNSKPSFSENGSTQKPPYLPPQIEVQVPESYQSNSTPVKPQRLVYELTQHFPPETRFLIDTGNWLAWAIHYFFPHHPENYRSSAELAAMGWGIGGAVGTALAIPNTPVVCLTGDGSFLMNGQEITVAVAERLPVIFVILNDQSYGMVKHRHRQVVKDSLEFAIPPVDFSLMAKAMGATGYTICNPQDLEKLDYQGICTYPGPTVLDVHIDSEEIPPVGMF